MPELLLPFTCLNEKSTRALETNPSAYGPARARARPHHVTPVGAAVAPAAHLIAVIGATALIFDI